MHRYVLCTAISAVVWIINGRWLAHAVRQRIASEIYIHTGLGLFFTLLVVELALGALRLWPRFDITWIQIFGFALYVPSACLVIASFHALKSKGRPESADPTATTAFVDNGVYGIVRQPMTLGMAIWSVALVLVFQSALAAILGVVSLVCFWISAKRETEYNLSKFGEKYGGYMNKVPMWNILRTLRKR